MGEHCVVRDRICKYRVEIFFFLSKKLFNGRLSHDTHTKNKMTFLPSY